MGRIALPITVVGLLLAACEGEVPYCGNGRLEAGEECDDGNSRDGDGCNRACRPEQVAPLQHTGCLVDFENVCPDAEPVCGVSLESGFCLDRHYAKCHFFGQGAMAALPGVYPAVLKFDHGVTSLQLFFAYSGRARGLIRFLDERDRDILAFDTFGDCEEATPAPVTVRLPRPARRAEVFAIGGIVYVDDVILDPGD
jgi:cysteine-rich repeat protein